jgi:NADH dehydrogenase [ubiquinone] 1 alpha subcomplex assembly factor 7
VDVDEDPTVPYHFKYVLAPGDSFASKALVPYIDAPEVNECFAEISPTQLGVIEAIATRMEKTGGSALIVDYGENDNMGLTLQGIRRHEFVHELTSPGDVDLSVRVNFKDLRKRVEKFSKLKCVGVTRQDHFLHCLAIETRMALLLKKQGDHDHLLSSYDKLTKDMGKLFKVMNINSHGSVPDGFQYISTSPAKK